MFVAGRSTKPTRRGGRRVVGALAVGLATCALAVPAPVAWASSPTGTQTTDAGILPFAGDVFTLGSNGSLIAVDPRSTPVSAPLFNRAGTPLNMTWGQFSSATASFLAKTVTKQSGDYTDFWITMHGLIPGGVYSLFYRTFGPDSNNPVCPNVDGLVALPARHVDDQAPDADSFVADSSGEATFDGRVAGDPLGAQILLIDVIYHFDGRTYGQVPNGGEADNSCRSSFGIDAMRQFLIAAN